MLAGSVLEKNMKFSGKLSPIFTTAGQTDERRKLERNFQHDRCNEKYNERKEAVFSKFAIQRHLGTSKL